MEKCKQVVRVNKDEKKPRGRPRAADGERRGENLTLRIRAELKEALEKQAAKSGRSLSAEAEVWLSQALLSDGVLHQALDLAFGRQLAGLVLLFGRVFRDTASFSGQISKSQQGPLDNPFVYDQITKGAARLFEVLRPPGPIEEPSDWAGLSEKSTDIGAAMANAALFRSSAAGKDPPLSERWYDAIRERLDPDLKKHIADVTMGRKALSEPEKPDG